MSTVSSIPFNDNGVNSYRLKKNVCAKDSFNRFGDDLSEVILSYLTFEDKFRFECVSNQFQRLVFNKIDAINVNHHCLGSLLGPFHYRKRVNIQALDSILKKCLNIRRVFSAEDAINEEEVFTLIIRYCSQLYEIESDFESLTEETIDKFCAKFGPKLKKMNFIPNNLTVKKIFKSCPNLEMLGYDWISLEDFFDENKLLVKKLKSFSFYYFPEDIQRFSVFVKSNRNTLRSLEMIVYDKTLTTSHTKLMFDQLLDLINLRNLGIFYYVSTDTSFPDFVRDLSEKCPKLSKIDFDLRINNSADILKVYKSFNRFKQLKTINLKNHIEDIPQMAIISESLKDCQNLCHLKVSGNTFKMTDQFFAKIDEHLHKLSTFHSSNADISAQGLDYLSKMSNLRSLSLVSLSLDSSITHSDVFAFIKKSPKISSIYLINSEFSCDFNRIDIEMFRQFDNLSNDLIGGDFFDDINNECTEQLSDKETKSDIQTDSDF